MASPQRTVLILGGYGTFGSRLARLLADRGNFTVIIAGRSRQKAEAFAKTLSGLAAFEVREIDRNQLLDTCFSDVDLVVDASGPFQDYGADRYRVAEAALASGAHYCDLADSDGFVAGIAELDEAARAAGRFVLSGLSSSPALSGAAMRHLADGMSRVDRVTAGIAPSPRVTMGLNVMRAIASYAGKPVAAGTALVDSRTRTLCPPGDIPLGPLRFALVDVPDYALLDQVFNHVPDMWFGAATRPAILQRLLAVMAWPVRLGLVPSLSGLAPLMAWSKSWFQVGEHRGGMFAALEGEASDGSAVQKQWSLIAEGDDGPFIPAIACAAVICQWLDGCHRELGARPAINELALADFEPFFERLAISHGCIETGDTADRLPLYRRVLGPAYRKLAEPIRQMHDVAGQKTVRGLAVVERGRGPLVSLIAAVMGLPKTGRDVPVTVQFTGRDGKEDWLRHFAGRPFRSTQEAGKGRFDGLIVERFGPLAFGLAMVTDEQGRLYNVVRKWSAFGLPMPAVLAPGGETFEHVADGRFNFHVEIKLPVIGLVVRYRGYLV